uniref:ACYPI008952 protein n=1 Tax=Acyrthosiphon pisum TaxID=7029 RepID=C4WT38_ACYPI|nr:ACYPI008952 [Acyrthosiphon pisum]
MVFNKKLVLLMVCMSAAMVSCQVPAIGGCPEFDSQPDFDMNRYLGTWYEAEHYVNIFEIGTRCVKTNYTKAVDGRYLVSNEIMNRFTGVKRVLDGEIRLIVKGSDSKMNVKYTTLPISYSTEQMILETDYRFLCRRLVLLVLWEWANTQNAWIMTREKLAPGTVMQKAYGVLDKYKLSKSYFRKTDQNSCALPEAAPNEPPRDNKGGKRRSLN